MIFSHRLDALFCFYCATQRKNGTLDNDRDIEDAYTNKGFSSWQKAPQCFEEHQQTHYHKSATSYHVVIPTCKDIGEMINEDLVR